MKQLHDTKDSRAWTLPMLPNGTIHIKVGGGLDCINAVVICFVVLVMGVHMSSVNKTTTKKHLYKPLKNNHVFF